MKILFYGDSNTWGYDPRSYFGAQYPPHHRWVDMVAQKLDCDAVNEGENGREIPRREAEFLRFKLMLAARAPFDLLVVMLGSNDLLQGNSAQTVAIRMEAFLERIDLDKQKILLIAPPLMKQGEWVTTQDLIDASHELGPEYEGLSSRLGVGFLDAGRWNIPLTFDGVHFTEEGHEAFAEGLTNYLNKGE